MSLGKKLRKLSVNCPIQYIFILAHKVFFPLLHSVPATSPFDTIDKRFNVDPKIQKQIRYASVVVCSNRPANNWGMSIEEIKYAISIGKPVVAVKITESTSQMIASLGIPVIAKRKDSLEAWISKNI